LTINSVDELEWDIITEEDAKIKSNTPGPVPFVKELSWTGELSVGFSENIVISGDPSKIP